MISIVDIVFMVDSLGMVDNMNMVDSIDMVNVQKAFGYLKMLLVTSGRTWYMW